MSKYLKPLISLLCLALIYSCGGEETPECSVNGERHGHVLVDGQYMACQNTITETSKYVASSDTSTHSFGYVIDQNISRLALTSLYIIVENDDYDNPYLFQPPAFNHQDIVCTVGTQKDPLKEVTKSDINFTKIDQGIEGNFSITVYCTVEDREIEIVGDFIGSF